MDIDFHFASPSGGRISGSDGGDFFWGGSGRDLFYAFGGTDFIFGNDGDDYITKTGGSGSIFGGLGIDELSFHASRQPVVIDMINGVVTGESIAQEGVRFFGIERVGGSTYGNDLVIGNDDDNRIFTFRGNDFVAAGGGNDEVSGGVGSDTIYAGSGFNSVFGRSGADNFMFESHRGHEFRGDTGIQELTVLQDFDVSEGDRFFIDSEFGYTRSTFDSNGNGILSVSDSRVLLVGGDLLLLFPDNNGGIIFADLEEVDVNAMVFAHIGDDFLV